MFATVVKCGLQVERGLVFKIWCGKPPLPLLVIPIRLFCFVILSFPALARPRNDALARAPSCFIFRAFLDFRFYLFPFDRFALSCHRSKPLGPGRGTTPRAPGTVLFKYHLNELVDGCDHTSTNALDPIRTPKLSVLGRE